METKRRLAGLELCVLFSAAFDIPQEQYSDQLEIWHGRSAYQSMKNEETSSFIHDMICL